MSAWSAAVLSIGAAVTLAVYLDRGDPAGAARAIGRELEFRLERGEVVEQTIPVVRRHWWHFFRVSHGILVATDRRLIFLSVPPQRLLRIGDELLEMEHASWRYTDGVTVARSRPLPGRPAPIHLSGGGRAEMLLLAGRNVRGADSLFSIVGRHQAELRASREAEERAMEATRAASRRAIYHEVRPGESLALLAARYGASLDSLRVWNGLAYDRIVAGQRLKVKPER